MQSNNFAKAAPNAIAPDGVTQCLFDAPAEPTDVEVIGAQENRKLATRFAASAAIHGVIFNATHQTAGARKIESRRIRRA